MQSTSAWRKEMGHMPPVEGDHQDMQTPVSDRGHGRSSTRQVQQGHSQPNRMVEQPPELPRPG